jgi:uncharacterized damage-inducible protein DinB
MKKLALFLLLPAAAAMAAENPLSDFNKIAFGQVKSWLLKSAEKMPEENYGFRPTDEVRSFGQIIGHVADAQYLFCSAALGEKNPAPNVEKTKTSKADLIAALQDAGAYCDRAFNTMTDAAGVEMTKLGTMPMPKLSVLSVTIAHLSEHYGNLVTYLRLKHIVPPSTEQMQAAAAAAKK